MDPRVSGQGGRGPVEGERQRGAERSASRETSSGTAADGYLPSPSSGRTPVGTPVGTPGSGTGIVAVRGPVGPVKPGTDAASVEVVSGDLLLRVNAPRGYPGAPADTGTLVEPCPPERRPGAAAALAGEPGAAPVGGLPGAVAPPALPGSGRPSETAATVRLGAPTRARTAALDEAPDGLLEREAIVERLRTLLAQGRSVRLAGPHGAGRTSVLAEVAHGCEGLAPAGVVRLSGHRRTVSDLLQDLFAATAAPSFRADAAAGRPRFRPDRAQLQVLLRSVGAIVVIDDVEFGGELLEELLGTAPECAFLVSATPDVPAPLPTSRMEESTLGGLSRAGGLRLLADRAGRPLTDDERTWAADLWFESSGLPLRFVQAAALLRHRDAARSALVAGALSDALPPSPGGAAPRGETATGGAAPRLDPPRLDPPRAQSARGGAEQPPPLPRRVPAGPGERPDGARGPVRGRSIGPGPRAEEREQETMAISLPLIPGTGRSSIPPGFAGGLFEPGAPAGGPAQEQPEAWMADGRVRLAPLPPIEECSPPAVRLARGLSEEARRTLRLAVALGGECPSAAHLSTLADVARAESAVRELVEAGLAARVGAHVRLTEGVAERLLDADPAAGETASTAQHFAWWTGHASVMADQVAAEAEVLLAALQSDRDRGRHGAVVQLARAAAPCFALALLWSAWERALRFGLEAARTTGEVAEEAWFHHELGVLAFCVGSYDRARAELEAAVALRAALGDTRGVAVGRQVLELLGVSTAVHGITAPGDTAGRGRPRRLAALASGGAGGIFGPGGRRGGQDGQGARGGMLPAGLLTRRNVTAAASGAVLIGALASVVALGAGTRSDPHESAPLNVAPVPSASLPGEEGPGLTPSPTASGSASVPTAGSTAVRGGPLVPAATSTGIAAALGLPVTSGVGPTVPAAGAGAGAGSGTSGRGAGGSGATTGTGGTSTKGGGGSTGNPTTGSGPTTKPTTPASPSSPTSTPTSTGSATPVPPPSTPTDGSGGGSGSGSSPPSGLPSSSNVASTGGTSDSGGPTAAPTTQTAAPTSTSS